MIKECKLSDLVFDYNIYPRNDVSSSHVTALCDSITLGDDVGALVADQKSKRVTDGFHRGDAFKRLDIKIVRVQFKDYKSEAEMFADSVRLNNRHGRSFDPYDRKRAVMKLQEYGLSPAEISTIVKIPSARLVELTDDFVKTRGGATVVLKQGLVRELRGKVITKAQVDANERWSGYNPAYHVNQLIAIIEADIVPTSDAFIAGMNRLTDLWKEVKK